MHQNYASDFKELNLNLQHVLDQLTPSENERRSKSDNDPSQQAPSATPANEDADEAALMEAAFGNDDAFNQEQFKKLQELDSKKPSGGMASVLAQLKERQRSSRSESRPPDITPAKEVGANAGRSVRSMSPVRAVAPARMGAISFEFGGQAFIHDGSPGNKLGGLAADEIDIMAAKRSRSGSGDLAGSMERPSLKKRSKSRESSKSDDKPKPTTHEERPTTPKPGLAPTIPTVIPLEDGEADWCEPEDDVSLGKRVADDDCVSETSTKRLRDE